MTDPAQRYLVTDPRAVTALRRDGFGWDHDGAGLMLAAPARDRVLARLWDKLKRRMKMSRLEHVNISVTDPDRSAELLEQL